MITEDRRDRSLQQGVLQDDELGFGVLSPKEQFVVELSRAFGVFAEVQMYSSSGKLRAKASPPCPSLLPYHTAWSCLGSAK